MMKRSSLLREKEDAQEASTQAELFEPNTTVHELLSRKCPHEALNAAQRRVLEPSPPSLPKALAGRMGRQILDTATDALLRETDGASDLGYSYSAWSLAGLPHRDQPKEKNWKIETDYARLLIRPGVRLTEDSKEEFLGVPFGRYARLLLVDWQTEALKRGSRDITMGKSAAAIVARLGVGRGGPVNAKIAEQLERLATCAVDFTFGTDRKGVVVNERLVEAFAYIGDPDPRSKRRIIQEVRLSDGFYTELRRHPVMVDRAALRDITTSPLAIDIYLWLAYRLHSLQKETPIPWSKLWAQFGSQVALQKNFRPQFEGPLHLALSTYPKAKVRISDRGLLLEPSPPPIAA